MKNIYPPLSDLLLKPPTCFVTSMVINLNQQLERNFNYNFILIATYLHNWSIFLMNYHLVFPTEVESGFLLTAQ